MKLTGKGFLVISLLLSVFRIANCTNKVLPYEVLKGDKRFDKTVYNNSPKACNDTFLMLAGCNSYIISGNALQNDFDSEGDDFILDFIRTPNKETMSMDSKGNFTFCNPVGFLGTISFRYKICETGNASNFAEATVVIIVKNDNDCDGIPDDTDIDNDNDGILDIDDGLEMDTDEDGILNYLDIDSDGDGIVDNIEGQAESIYAKPLGLDYDKDGWDDAYDPHDNGKYFELADTDSDGTPDFLDNDSDNDNITDLVEAHNENNILSPLKCDIDNDGLDDAFDSVNSWWNSSCNTLGSNTPLPDTNKDGVRDWRDNYRNKSIKGFENNLSGPAMYFTLYPNPTSRFFRINNSFFDDVKVIDFEIYNLEGKLLKSQKDVSINSNIDTRGIKPGNYIIKINSVIKSVTNRLIIRY